MVKKIQVTFGNKTFYTLIAIVVLLAVAGIVLAVINEWDSSKAMWHDASDVKVLLSDGKYYDLQTAINVGFVTTEVEVPVPTCTTPLPFDFANINRIFTQSISLPDYCMNSQECIFTFKIYNSKGLVKYIIHIYFNQTATKSWTSIGDDWFTTYQKSGKNGDVTSSKIYYAHKNWLLDDLSGTENDANTITYENNGPASDGSAAASLDICPSNQ